ncbi:Hypothetical predicted protein [Cloeon dipterum]|uniref:HP domain-containing protein n=1 Tax=Cloeon dipterum TaxID=197152 RepID=A0A8S1DTY0_9INSE|nr:Hypothetical predicted protein [Cloeon dipterum]
MYLMQTVSHPPVPRNKVITVMDPPIEAVKKQKTKWTLGSLFRRRTTNKQQQEAAESSSEEEADKKQHQRSFLSHRRSNRKRSERKAKEKSAKIKIEQQPWSGSANSLAGSSEGFGSHSSLSRRDRRELVKARVEATRRDSSSDDNDFTLHQSSSLTRFKSDDSLSSLNRRTRAARTERYMKRIEKSSESSEYHPANNATWNATVVSYRETSPFVRAVSATPSPVVSPKMGHRPLPPQMMSPPRSRRSYCCEQPPPFMPRNNPTPQMYASSAFLPFSPKQAPPPPPRDPQRRFMGTPQQYANVEAKPVYRSRSDHQLPQGDYANTSIFPSSSQTQFKYLADRTPRSRRPIHVIPVHEQSPECILPMPPAWLNEPPQPAKKQSTSPPIRRVSSIEVTLRTPSKTPPPPPVRRYSRQSSVSSVEDEMPKVHAKPAMVTASTNLEDALNELEEIYQSLQLGDEDLLDRAERRDLPTAFQLKRASSVDVSDDGIVLKRTSRAPPLRRSGVPDLVTDDMAYRRLKNPTTGPPAKDRTSGSYLLVSPALSPIPVQTLDPEEPNTTFDDMSYRAIKDANLMGNKVLDPQPPFGIPLTPAPPAANSDYLHAKPTDKYRSTFRPRKTPDLVNDDLAFRNLRKDNNKVGELKHKRAVRSLSANLMNLMEQRDEIEKTQSLGNLPESLQVLLEGSELRSSPGSRPPPSWVERAHLLDTSTETLTQSRANLRSLRNSFLSSDAESRPLSLFVPSNQISPIKEVETAVPANASTDYSEQFDEERLEELLSALAQEAQDTSEKLGKELERLRDGSHSVEDLTKSPTFYQGNQCAALKFEPVSLNATSSYLPVYNHTECETNLPKALHEDINNNSKMKFETEQAPESLSSSEPDEINVDLAEIECNGSQFVAPELISSTESPRSRTLSIQSELCTIHEECHREEDLDIEGISVEIVTESESIQAEIEENVLSESKDYNMVAEVASEISDIEIIVDEIVEAQHIDDEHANELEEENIEDSSLSSSEEIEDDEACTRFGVPKLNFDNLNENAEYEEADFETIFKQSFSDDKKEEAVLAYEKLSSDVTVESANNALTCELIHVSSENNSLCLSSNNSSLLTLNTESNLKLSETISDTSLIVPDATIASPETFSESSVPDMVQLTEVDQASDYSDDLSDKTIEPQGLERLDDENVTDEVEKNETEVNESIEEAEQFSLTDHSTLLLPLLQMAREENNKSSSTFQRTVEKLDALIAAASTDIDAPCDFENNNCKGGKDEPAAEDDREADFDRSFASSLRHDPSQSAFRTPPGHRSPSIRNVFQVAEPCVEAMNSQIKASEKRRLMSVNLNGSPSKVDKSDSTSPSSSGLDNGEKSPTKRPQRKSAELSQIRTTRTSRLRAAAANASSPSSDSALSDSKPTARLKSTVPPVRKLLVDYPDSSSSSREGTPLGKNIAKLDETGDKSAKRKSVLNKANAEKLSSGESTTDDGSSRLKNRMAPSPKSSTTCRSLRPTSNQPSSSQNLRNASDPAKVESKKIIEVGKSELSKRADNLLARYKECDSRLDNLAARKASRNKAAPMAKKILHSATKENEKNIDKARAKDEVEEEEAPKKILAPNNSSEKSSAGNSAANSRQSPVKERKTSILKKKSIDDATGPVSILKHEVASSVQPSVSVKAPSPRPQSILKKKSSVDEPSCEERSGEEFEDEPQGILKRKSSTSNKGKMHTILKKKSSEELLPEDSSGRRSAEGDESNYSSANSSPVRRSPSVKVEEGVIRNQVNLTLRFNQQADQEDGPFESACLSASEDENSRRGPSVSERAQLFMRLQEMHRLPSNDTPSTSKGFATSSGDDLPPMVTTRRERAKRFSTQPVTSEEVDEAKSQISVGPEPISIPTPATMTGDSDDEEEEPSSLSLAERVRLFTQKIEQQNRQPKEGQPVQKRTVKKQVTSTRFRTLPVTDAEVEGFSNTLGTRHQPSGLDGLVARAAMETSRSDPIDVDPRPRGILKHCSSMGSNSYPPLSTEPLIPPEETDIVRGILKIPASVIANALGSQQQSAFSSSFKSALKKESSTDERSNQSPTRSILKTGKVEEWTESSSEEEINSGEIKENLASLLNDVATQAEEERTILSSDTECDTSSSGGREVKKIISSAIEYRDTVATLTATASAVHQQQQGVAPEQEPKQRASSAEEASSWGPPPAAEPPKVVKKFEAAIKPAENEQGKKESDSVSKISIAERLALLKQNGETEWKKRVPRASPGDELASNGNKDAGYKCEVVVGPTGEAFASVGSGARSLVREWCASSSHTTVSSQSVQRKSVVMILVLLTAGGVFLVVLYNLLFKKNTPIEDDKKNILPMSELPLSETYPPVRSEPPPLLSVHAPEIKVNVETTAAPAAPVEEVVVAAPAEAAVVFATPAQAVLPPQEENWVIEADELTAQSTGTEVLKVADLSTPSIASCSATLSEIDNTLKRLESRITSVVQDSNELTADEESYLLQNTQDLLLTGEVAASAAPVSSENESAAAGKGDEEAANILRDVKPTAEEITVEISQPTSVSLADIEQQIIALAEKEAQVVTKIESEIADAAETVVAAEPEQKTSVETKIVPAEVQTGIFQATPVAVAEEPVVETPVPAPSEVSPVEAVAPEPERTAPLTPEKESVVAETIESVNVSTVEITVTEPVAEASDPVLESVAPQADKASVEAFKTDDSAEMPIVESPILESVVGPVTETPGTVVEPTPNLPISEVIAQESIPLVEAVVPVEEIPIAESVVESAAPKQVPEISLSESVNISVEEPKSIDAKEDPGSVEPFPAVEEVSSVSNISDSAAPGDIAAVPLESALETKAVVLETSFVPETHQLVPDISAELTDAVETLVLAEVPQKPTTEATSENVVEPLPAAVETAIEPVTEAPTESRMHEVVSSEPEIKSEEISEPERPDAVSSKISETKSDELLVEAPAKSPSTPDNSPDVSVSIDKPKSTVNVSSVSEEVDSVINEAVDILEKRLTEQVESAPEASKDEPQLVDISDNSPVTQTEIKEEKATESLVELVIEPPKESAGSVPDSSADKAEIKLETLAAAEPLILDEAAKTEEKVEGTPKPTEVATSLLVDLSEPKAAVEVDLESFVVVPKEKQVTADIDNVYTLIAECQSGITKEVAGSAPSDAPINSPTTTVSNPPTANEAANAPSANE